MKRNSPVVAVGGVCMMGLLAVAGCQPVFLPVLTVLDPSLGAFVVEAGIPSTNSGSVTFDNTSGISIGSGRLRLDPEAITVTTTGTGKFIAFQTTTTTLTITARVALSDRETVCETGETYGPFTLTLTTGFGLESVEPSSVALTQSTIDLLNAGSFSLCLEVLSPFDAMVSVESIVFDLGL